MQIFNYVAKDQNGVLQKGKVEARDDKSAATILRQKNLVIIKLLPIGAPSGLAAFGIFSSKVKSQDIVTFTQQLSTMIDSGLPLSDALTILQSQSKPALSKVIAEMTRDIQGGLSFADALIARKGVFSPIYVATVKAGEAAGKLDVVLAKLAETEAKKREFAAKTKGALIYPVIVMVVMILVMAAMMIFVIPKLLTMFDEFGTELPFATKALMAMSRFSQQMWWVILLIIFGLVYLVRRWYATKIGRVKIDEFVLKLPVYGVLKTQIVLADVTRTLSLLVGAGISILDALEIVTKSSSNIVFETALKNAAKGVEKGLPFATMLAREEVFPPLLSQMVLVGEETGKLSEILVKVADYFEGESDNAIKNLTTAIEPLIMVILGVGVMFLVLAILMPIYQLTSSF